MFFTKKNKKDIYYINQALIVGAFTFAIFIFILYNEILYISEDFLSKYFQIINYGIGFIVGIFMAVIFFLVFNNIKRKNLYNLKRSINSLNYIDNDNIISTLTNIDGTILNVTDSFYDTYGYTKDEVIGSNHNMIKSNKIPEEDYISLWYSIQKGEIWEGEFLNKTKNGEELWMAATIIPEIDNNKIVGYRSISYNITLQKKANFLLEHDSLTKLPNKFSFEKSIQHTVTIANKQDSKIAILFLDINNFKDINEQYEYKGGDEVIKIVANRIHKNLSNGDILSRHNGDEFIIMLEDIEDKNILGICNSIMNNIEQDIVINNDKINITVSIGVSIFPDNASTVSELIKNANSAMHYAKDKSQNNIIFFNTKISEMYKRKLDIESTILDCLKNDGFKLVYQPKYNIKTHKITGAEALIRMKNNKYYPNQFIDIAEQTSIISEISKFVIRKTFEDLSKIKNNIQDDEFRISINLSSQDIKDMSILNYILEYSSSYNVPTSKIGIEITEYTLMQDVNKTIETLNKFKEKGLKIYIDDFGTGYSSMNYLKLLPIDIIKIDKSFIDGLESDERDKHIVSAIVNLSNSLHFETVVEGIENDIQEKILLEMGCLFGQGYNYSRPLEFDDFVEIIN